MIPYIVCEKINYFVFNSKAENKLKRNKWIKNMTFINRHKKEIEYFDKLKSINKI